MMIQIHPMTSCSEEFDVYISAQGRLSAHRKGTDIPAIAAVAHGYSWAELQKNLNEAVKLETGNTAVRFAVLTGGGKVRRGTATGIHASQGHILVQWDDGTRGSVQPHETVYGDLSLIAAEALEAVRKNQADALRVMSEFHAEHGLALKAAVLGARGGQ